MPDETTMSYAQALARLIADPETTYRLRQRIKDDPLLNQPLDGAVSTVNDGEMLERLQELRREDAQWPNESLPELGALRLDDR